jgi:hypothetical protein
LPDGGNSAVWRHLARVALLRYPQSGRPRTTFPVAAKHAVRARHFDASRFLLDA